ncbi:MAG: CHAD domain-containing protein [Burkholderiaceae bacterium]|nr:CHAD domain-containing protein [Burkholderiaceae bacterium]
MKPNLRSHLVKQLRRAAKGATLMASLMRKGDASALHDIRVQARTMASVLQPFVELPHMKPLRRALEPIASWVRKSNRVRDTEAQLELIAELLPGPCPIEVERHLAQVEKDMLKKRAALAQSRSLVKLPRRISRLAKVTELCLGRMSSAGLSAVVGFACEKLMLELREDCAEGLQVPKRWHQARLRIKQLRYLIENYPDYLDQRYLAFAHDTKQAQQDLGRLRDWQNLRTAMSGVPAIAQWLAAHAELEQDLAQRAGAAMGLLARALASWE